VSPRVLKTVGVSAVAGLVIGALLLSSVILLGVPQHPAALSWAIGLLVLSVVIPPFIAEADLRSRPGGQGDKRIWGESSIRGTMHFADAFAYLIREDQRVIMPRDGSARPGA
jgi:hypothetical protein